MAIWTSEIKELEKLYESFKGQFPELEKELGQLIKSEDANVILLYSRRCLEVIITDLCECELKRPRKTEPLKGIIDKLHKEEKVPSHIITSMHGLNELSTYGTHPKDFDPEQVKPVLNNLDIIIKWYLKYRGLQIAGRATHEEEKHECKPTKVSTLEKSIIVLPFENMSPDPDQEYFSDGLTEEIITDLSYIKNLLVISRSSAMTFKGTKKKIGEIAREVNVHYVLEGSVRKAGNNLRITAQLIDGVNDSHIWAEKFSGTLDDVFNIQEEVSRSIADALKLKLIPEEYQKIAEHNITNIQAYECYLKANSEILKFTENSTNQALRYLQSALDITGDNALLYSGIAFAYWQLVNIGVKQEEYLFRAEEYVNKALAKDPNSAKAYATLGWIYHLKANPNKSSLYLKKALSINPNDTFALQGLAGVYIALVGKISAAIPLCDKLRQIEPFDFMTNFSQILLYFYAGQFDQFLQETHKVIMIYPEISYVIFMHATALIYNKRNDEAFKLIEEMAKKDPDNAIVKVGCMLKYSLQGKRHKVVRILTPDLKKTCLRDPTFSHQLSVIFSLLNEKNEALEWVKNSISVGFLNFPMLNEYDPFLKNIRGEERFKKLMERVKYEWENFEV